MRTCSNCGAQLDNDALFCTECGTKIDVQGKFCPSCGARLDDDSLFCSECGTKLDVSPNQPIDSIVVENMVVDKSESIIDIEESSWLEENKKWLWYR